jgi:hypothetical protein
VETASREVPAACVFGKIGREIGQDVRCTVEARDDGVITLHHAGCFFFVTRAFLIVRN